MLPVDADDGEGYQVALDRSRNGKPHLNWQGTGLSVLMDLPLVFSILLVSTDRPTSFIKTFPVSLGHGMSHAPNLLLITFTTYFLHSFPPTFLLSFSPSFFFSPPLTFFLPITVIESSSYHYQTWNSRYVVSAISTACFS